MTERLLGLLSLLSLVAAVPAKADNCAVPYPNLQGVVTVADTILLVPTNGGSLNLQGVAPSTGPLTNAADSWNSKCGDGVPSFTLSGSGDITVNVEFYGVNNPGNLPGCSSCGCATVTIVNGQIVGAVVRKFTGPAGGGSGCGSVSTMQILRHELGHVLGLQEVPSGCQNRIMKNKTRPPDTADCDVIDNIFSTTGDPGGGHGGCGGTPVE